MTDDELKSLNEFATYLTPNPKDCNWKFRDSTKEEVAEAWTVRNRLTELDADIAFLLSGREDIISDNDLSFILMKLDECRTEKRHIREKCTHPVFYDENGWTYHPRTCLRCKVTFDMI